jgi:hypothetical protein
LNGNSPIAGPYCVSNLSVVSMIVKESCVFIYTVNYYMFMRQILNVKKSPKITIKIKQNALFNKGKKGCFYGSIFGSKETNILIWIALIKISQKTITGIL